MAGLSDTTTGERKPRKNVRIAMGADGISFLSVDSNGIRREEHGLVSAKGDPERFRALKVRLSLVQALKHSAFLRLSRVNLEGDVPGFVVITPARTLLDEIAEGPLPLSNTVALGLEIAEAFAEAHAVGLAHGCLCPGHVFLQEGRPAINFAGVATGDHIPLRGYDATCRADGESVSPEADIYALGALLSIVSSKAGAPLAPLSQAESDLLYDLSRRMLALEPADRPGADEVARILQTYLQGSSEMGGELETLTSHRGPEIDAIKRTSFRAGDEVGRYRLLELLGEGGMGQVYRAEDKTTGDIVAIKLLHSWIRDDRTRRRFLREARFLQNVVSPYVARFWEAQPNGSPPFIAMEFLPGKSLDLFVRDQGRFSEDQALQVAADLARGLADIHALGIVHRDVKPSNVIMQEESPGTYRAKLCDFGIARQVTFDPAGKITHTGAFVGTPQYMAPEQAMGGDVDVRVDVYGLGATLYAILAGKPPLQPPTGGQVDWTQKPDFVFLSRLVEPEVMELIEKAMARKPAERFSDAQAFLEALEEVRRGERVDITSRPGVPTVDDVMRFELVMELNSTPAELWPYVSNTDRLNHAIGIGAVEVKRALIDGRMQTYGKSKALGLEIEWREYPFEWVAPKRLGVLREFRKGPLKWYRSTVNLEARNGGTRLLHVIECKPDGLLGKVAAKIAVGVQTRRALAKVYRRIDQMAPKLKQNIGIADDPFEPTGNALLPVSNERLVDICEGLRLDGCNPAVVRELESYLERASAQDLGRIRPKEWAGKRKLDTVEVVKTFLRAAHGGALVLGWDVICPSCRVATNLAESLANIRDHGKCEACDVNFEVNFARSIELVFQAHPQVREPEVRTYCIGGPAHRPHVALQVELEPGQRFSADLELSPGRYRVVTDQRDVEWAFAVSEDCTIPRLELALDKGVVTARQKSVSAARQELILANDLDRHALVRVERDSADGYAFTAAEACCIGELRELFPRELLSPGVMVGVSQVAAFIAEIADPDVLKSSEEWNLGRAVSELRTVVEDEVIKEGGLVLKIVGQGVMAVFCDPVACVRAALALVELPLFRQVKISAHRGPALVTTVNGRLEYFGQVTRRLEEMCRVGVPGTLGLSDAVVTDPGVVATLTLIENKLNMVRSDLGLWRVEVPEEP